MDHCYTGGCDWSNQTTEKKDIPCFHLQDRSSSVHSLGDAAYVGTETVQLLVKFRSGQVVQDTTSASKRKMSTSSTTPTKASKKKFSSDALKTLDDK